MPPRFPPAPARIRRHLPAPMSSGRVICGKSPRRPALSTTSRPPTISRLTRSIGQALKIPNGAPPTPSRRLDPACSVDPAPAGGCPADGLRPALQRRRSPPVTVDDAGRSDSSAARNRPHGNTLAGTRAGCAAYGANVNGNRNDGIDIGAAGHGSRPPKTASSSMPATPS